MKTQNRWIVLRWFFKYLSPLIRIFEKIFINKYTRINCENQPVFIIGAPRTGSTVLYEILTNYLDVSYINNLSYLARNNFFVGLLLSKFLFKDKPHNFFESIHGNTFSGGLNAPHECGQFWNQCIPVGIDYISEEMAGQFDCAYIKKTIIAISNRFGKPVLFKNLNAGMRIALITKLFPQSKFIFIKRDPVYTAQSILLGRKKVFENPSEWWSVKPPNYKELSKLPYIEQIVKQTYFIEKQIVLDLKKYSCPENVLTINYENLNNTSQVISKVERFIKNTNHKFSTKENFVSIKVRNTQKINDDEFNSIKYHVNEMDF